MSANSFEVTAAELKEAFERLQSEYEKKESKQIDDHKAYQNALGVLRRKITEERAKINNDKSLDPGVRRNLLTGYDGLYGDINISFNNALNAFEAMSPSMSVAEEEQKDYTPIPTRKITEEEYNALQQNEEAKIDTRSQELVQPMNQAFKRREDEPAEISKDDLKVDNRPQELVQPMNLAFKRREIEEPTEAKTDTPSAEPTKASWGSRFINWVSRRLRNPKSEISSSNAGVETSVQEEKTTVSASEVANQEAAREAAIMAVANEPAADSGLGSTDERKKGALGLWEKINTVETALTGLSSDASTLPPSPASSTSTDRPSVTGAPETAAAKAKTEAEAAAKAEQRPRAETTFDSSAIKTRPDKPS